LRRWCWLLQGWGRCHRLRAESCEFRPPLNLKDTWALSFKSHFDRAEWRVVVFYLCFHLNLAQFVKRLVCFVMWLLIYHFTSLSKIFHLTIRGNTFTAGRKIYCECQFLLSITDNYCHCTVSADNYCRLLSLLLSVLRITVI
jgi:hypothetical protein